MQYVCLKIDLLLWVNNLQLYLNMRTESMKFEKKQRKPRFDERTNCNNFNVLKIWEFQDFYLII